MDKDTFTTLTLARSESLYRIAYAILRSDEDCRDALQETALRAWASRDTLRDEAVFGTWLTRILINVCRTTVRKRRRLFLTEAPEDFPAPSSNTDALDALRALPQHLRIPATLHYVEGYSVQETADILHLPLSTVRGRLFRARKTLRLELDEEVFP